MIANEVFNRGLSSVLINIINKGDLGLMEANDYVGKRFIEVVQLIKSELNYLVIGVVRDGEVILNPGNDFVIQSGDSLLVIR
ncbi:hypothetical protein [Vulcanisaeta sp. JCM 16161]|uniref:CASTOR/POLLUX-related putative ion channel n=1 Tax=Vulcanisaeta sp. JCM 16161 TaxID=1295372 RepID=UPI001FB2FCED|nr:TrkA C-terminal domain-containing protein [Vulcanisaeta sp. JCM 16161]